MIINWKPDVCKCEFEITPQFDLVKVVFKCPMHESLEDEVCFTAVIQQVKDINLTPMLDGETDEEYQNRRWLLKEAALQGN